MSRHLALALMVPAALLALAGCGESADTVTVTVGSDGQAIENAPAQNPEADSGTTTQDGQAITQRQVGGAPARDGNVTFRVTAIKQVASIPGKNEYSDATVPAKGTKLWAVTVAVRNDGKTSAMPLCGGGGFTAIDQDDRNFDMDTTAAIDASEDFCTSLQPGFRGVMTIPVRTPSDARIRAVGTWDSDEEEDYSGDKSWTRWRSQ
jgi:hypothetical protein